MTRLAKRVDALEEVGPSGFIPYTRIVVGLGDTVENAVATYESKNGPVPDDRSLILRVVAARGVQS